MKAFTVKELANILTRTPRTIQRRAVQEQWPYDERCGLGGVRRLYPFITLPQDVQIAVIAQWDSITSDTAIDEITTLHHALAYQIAAHELHAAQPSKTTLKLCLLVAAYHHADQLHSGKIKGFDSFCKLYNRQKLEISPTIYTRIKTLSRITLLRWEKCHLTTPQIP